MKAKRKQILTVCLSLALVACALVGTIAYMTAKDDKTNTFTVGSFDDPTKPPSDGGQEGGSDKGKDTEEDGSGDGKYPDSDKGEDQLPTNFKGHILEAKWDATTEHKLLPGASVEKDPRIGIGANSEEAYVYAYVKNDVLNNTAKADENKKKYVSFLLNAGWEPVSADSKDYFVKGNDVSEGTPTYVSGLFRYKGTTSDNGSSWTYTLKPEKNKGVWTGTIFSKVDVSEEADLTDFNTEDSNSPTITVSAFIHQAKDGEDNSLKGTADAAAIEWAKGLDPANLPN